MCSNASTHCNTPQMTSVSVADLRVLHQLTEEQGSLHLLLSNEGPEIIHSCPHGWLGSYEGTGCMVALGGRIWMAASLHYYSTVQLIQKVRLTTKWFWSRCTQSTYSSIPEATKRKWLAWTPQATDCRATVHLSNFAWKTSCASWQQKD